MNDLGLWDRVQSQGHDLLAGPITLRCETDGGETSWKLHSGRFRQTRADAAVFEGSADSQSVSVRTTPTIEFDGCMKVEMDLTPVAAGPAVRRLVAGSAAGGSRGAPVLPANRRLPGELRRADTARRQDRLAAAHGRVDELSGEDSGKPNRVQKMDSSGRRATATNAISPITSGWGEPSAAWPGLPKTTGATSSTPAGTRNRCAGKATSSSCGSTWSTAPGWMLRGTSSSACRPVPPSPCPKIGAATWRFLFIPALAWALAATCAPTSIPPTTISRSSTRCWKPAARARSTRPSSAAKTRPAPTSPCSRTAPNLG